MQQQIWHFEKEKPNQPPNEQTVTSCEPPEMLLCFVSEAVMWLKAPGEQL